MAHYPRNRQIEDTEPALNIIYQPMLYDNSISANGFAKTSHFQS